MKVITENFAQTLLDFLLSDVDVALTFLDLAENSQDPETARRHFEKALKAYDIVVGKLPTVRPNPEQQTLLNAKLRLLRTRLNMVVVF